MEWAYIEKAEKNRCPNFVKWCGGGEDQNMIYCQGTLCRTCVLAAKRTVRLGLNFESKFWENLYFLPIKGRCSNVRPPTSIPKRQWSSRGLSLRSKVPSSSVMFVAASTKREWVPLQKQHLTATYNDRWIGRGGPIAWPPRSPDLTPMYFHRCGHITALIYTSSSEEKIIARIAATTETTRQQPGNFGRTRQCLLRRCRLCVVCFNICSKLLRKVTFFQNISVVLLNFQP